MKEFHLIIIIITPDWILKLNSLKPIKREQFRDLSTKSITFVCNFYFV